MARGTTRGSPGAKTDSNGNIEPRDPRPDSPKTILSLTSSIPGAFPDDVASIASIKSGIAPAVPGMLGALTGSSDKPLPDTQSETNSSGELRNEAIAGTSPTGSGGIREGSNDIGGYPTTNAYVTEPPPERKPASDTEETPAAEGSQHEALNMAIGSGSPDMGWRVMGIGASGTPGARRANLYDDQRVPIAIGATKNERRQSRDAAIAGALGPGILARNYISSSEHGMGGSTASKSDENGRAVPSTIGPRGLETTVRASPPRDQRGGDRLEPHDSRQSKPRDSTHENQAARDVALGTRAAGTGSVTYKHHDHIEQYGDDFAPPTQQGYADLTGVSGYTGHTHPNSTTAFGTADTSHQNTIGSHRQTEAGKDEPHHRRLLGFLHRDKDKKRGQGGGGSSAKQHHQSEPKAGNASIEMEHKYDERRRREFRGIRGTDASSTDPVGSDGSNHSVEKAGVHQPILDEAERQQKEPAKDEKTHHGLLGTLHHDKSKKCGEERDKKADYEAAAATASMITASEAIPGPTDQRLNGHRQSVRNKLSKEPPPNRYTADSAHAPASGASTAPSSDPGK